MRPSSPPPRPAPPPPRSDLELRVSSVAPLCTLQCAHSQSHSTHSNIDHSVEHPLISQRSFVRPHISLFISPHGGIFTVDVDCWTFGEWFCALRHAVTRLLAVIGHPDYRDDCPVHVRTLSPEAGIQCPLLQIRAPNRYCVSSLYRKSEYRESRLCGFS